MGKEKLDQTEKEHAEALLEMLSSPGHCTSCPELRGIWSKTENQRCGLCQRFIDMNEKFSRFWSDHGGSVKCPCHVLGPEEATKRTWIALEEKGYLD
jgi:hypothetical protein